MPRRHKLAALCIVGLAAVAVLVLALTGRGSDAVITAVAALAANMSANVSGLGTVTQKIAEVRADVDEVKHKFNGGLRSTLEELINRPTDLPATITLQEAPRELPPLLAQLRETRQ